jgi:hypothetical protein
VIHDHHNQVKILAFLVMRDWYANQGCGLSVRDLSLVLSNFTTNGSLWVLIGRWRRWGYVLRDSKGFRVRYRLAAKGKDYLERHEEEISEASAGKINAAIKRCRGRFDYNKAVRLGKK